MSNTTRHARNSRFAAAGAFCALALSLTACGGGGGGGGAAVPTPAATAPPTATPAPASQSQSVSWSTSAPTAISLGGVWSGNNAVVTNANVTLPQVNVPQTSASVTMTAAAPNGVPQPSLRKTHDKSRNTLGVPSTPLVYFTLSVSNAVTLTATPQLTLALAESVTQPCYLVGYDPANPSAGWNALAGPFAVANNSLNIPATTLNPALTLHANQPYVFAIVESNTVLATPVPAGSPTAAPTQNPTQAPTQSPTQAPTQSPTGSPTQAPTQSPTQAPTNAPTAAPTGGPSPGPLTLSTSSVTLNAAGETAQVFATENFYNGSFTASSSATNVATVTPGQNGSFTITAVAAGTATVTVSDNHGGKAAIAVTVTTTGVIIH